MPTESSILDALTATQQDVLQALAQANLSPPPLKRPASTAPPSISGPKNTPASPAPCSPPATTGPNLLLDELGGLADLALDTFRHILSDEQAPASVRLKAAMEIV